MIEKETICWECKNYAKCSWKDGIPVKNWKATPTIIVNKNVGGEKVETPSFLVEQCPQFVQDKWQVTAGEVAKICGICRRDFYRLSKEEIIERLKEKGYMLYIYDLNEDKKGKAKKSCYYIEKI